MTRIISTGFLALIATLLVMMGGVQLMLTLYQIDEEGNARAPSNPYCVFAGD